MERNVSKDIIRWGDKNPPAKGQVEFDDKELELKLIDIANQFRYMEERVFGKQIKVCQVFGNFEMPKGKTRSFVSVDISQNFNNQDPMYGTNMLESSVSKRNIDTIQNVLGDEYEFQNVESYFIKNDGELKLTISFMKKAVVIMEEKDDDYKKRVNEEVRMVENANEAVDNPAILIVQEE